MMIDVDTEDFANPDFRDMNTDTMLDMLAGNVTGRLPLVES